MKKYFTIENILLVVCAVILFIFALGEPFNPMLAAWYGAAIVMFSVGFAVVATRTKEIIDDLRKQLDGVRKNRDEYMSQYKEYWEKYDAKVSENKILEEKFRNADSKIQGYRDMYNQADEQVKQLKEQLARYEQLEKPEPEPVVAAAAKEKTQEVKKTIDKVKKNKKK